MNTFFEAASLGNKSVEVTRLWYKAFGKPLTTYDFGEFIPGLYQHYGNEEV